MVGYFLRAGEPRPNSLFCFPAFFSFFIAFNQIANSLEDATLLLVESEPQLEVGVQCRQTLLAAQRVWFAPNQFKPVQCGEINTSTALRCDTIVMRYIERQNGAVHCLNSDI